MLRKAYVGIPNPTHAESVAAYLPNNYHVTEIHRTYVVIEGEDRAGWTLDDYVIPRLASGLYFTKETVKPEDD